MAVMAPWTATTQQSFCGWFTWQESASKNSSTLVTCKKHDSCLSTFRVMVDGCWWSPYTQFWRHGFLGLWVDDPRIYQAVFSPLLCSASRCWPRRSAILRAGERLGGVAPDATGGALYPWRPFLWRPGRAGDGGWDLGETLGETGRSWGLFGFRVWGSISRGLAHRILQTANMVLNMFQKRWLIGAYAAAIPKHSLIIAQTPYQRAGQGSRSTDRLGRMWGWRGALPGWVRPI